MAQMAYVAKNIRDLEGAEVRHFKAGETIEVGELVFVAADGDVELADADNGNARAARAIGIVVAVSDTYGGVVANPGDGVTVCVHGAVGGFTSLVESTYGYVSETPGQIEDAAPTTNTNQYIVGIAVAENIFFVNPGMAAPTSV